MSTTSDPPAAPRAEKVAASLIRPRDLIRVCGIAGEVAAINTPWYADLEFELRTPAGHRLVVDLAADRPVERLVPAASSDT